MLGQAVPRCLGPALHAVIAQDVADPQPVALEDLLPPLALRPAMRRQLPPALHRRLVFEEADREQLARVGQALEALDEEVLLADEAQRDDPPRRPCEVRDILRVLLMLLW